MPKLYIGTPYTRPFEAGFVSSLFATHNEGHTGWLRTAGWAVDDGRNEIVRLFLETDGEFLLFADSDATWHPAAAMRLMGHDLPMVVGCMYRRRLPPTPTMGIYNGRTNDGRHIYRFGPAIEQIMAHAKFHGVFEEGVNNNAHLFPQTDQDLWEVDGSGLHFALIRRDVIEALPRPMFIHNINGAGEDFYFCQQVKSEGFKIFCDLSVHTGHIVGEGADFGINELLSYMKFTDEIVDVNKFVMETGP